MFLGNKGQAAVEYLFVLVFSVLVLTKVINSLADFMADSVGNLGHVVTVNLQVGVCPERCFFSGYKNAKQ